MDDDPNTRYRELKIAGVADMKQITAWCTTDFAKGEQKVDEYYREYMAKQYRKKQQMSEKEVQETTDLYLTKIKGKLGNVYSNFLEEVKRKIEIE